MNIDEDIWIEDGKVIVRGGAPTVIKMSADTPRKLIALSQGRIDAERALETAKKEVPPAEAELSACIATCEKLQNDIAASLQLIREEEERVKAGNNTGPIIQAELAEDHKKLEAEYLANVTKLAAADRAYEKAVSNVGKAEVNVRTAISEYLNQEKLYRQQKQAEEISTQEVKAFEARLRELQIKAEKDRIEAGKKRLAELGVSEQ